MLKKFLKKTLAVVMTGAVIASASAVSLPVFAAVSASDPIISQYYSIPNYDPDREFHPKRHGDIINYGKNTLKFSWGNTNRIPTGIWGSVGEKIKVYVQAGDNDPLPSLFFVQHIGMWQDLGNEKTIKLQKGINEITVPQTFADSSKFEVAAEPGGCIYILNPYTEQQQSNNVRIYIEGGDKFPVFQKGDDTKAFTQQVRDYYSHYSNGEQGYHNVTEICSDHACVTLTLERVYDAVVKGGISPQKTTESVDNFLCYLMEFDNITPEEYKNVYQHIKVNQPYAGAYAYFNIIGIQDNNWSGCFFSDKYGWGFPHEYGHIIDNSQKVLSEVTNNVYSLKYVLDNEMYFDIAIDKPIADPNSLSASDTTTVWSVDPKGYTAVYMFWDLEVYKDGFNGKLDDMLRDNSCGDSTVDSYLSNCSAKEKVVAYSSKILGIDMRYYFKRYGYITSLSSNCDAAISSMNLSNEQPKIWYYDSDAYIKSKGSNLNISVKPSLFNYETSSKTMYFNVPIEAADNHLGFEIMKDGKFVAYVWDDQYTNSNLSGTYTVNAYDRSLNKYASFTVNTSDSNSINRPVAKVGSVNYRTIEDAVKAATDGETVYLLGSSTIRDTVTINGKYIRLAPADEKKRTVIYNGVGSKNVFSVSNGGELTVKTQGDSDNVLVFDSQSKQSKAYFNAIGKSYIEIGKGVTVRRCKSSDLGSAISATGSTVVLSGCIIERNNGNKGTIYLSGSELVSGEGTIIRYNRASQSGSAIQADQNNSIEITNTTIYKNTGGSKDQSGTVYLIKSDISVGDGTVIKGNQSDWYGLNSGICVTADSNAVFSGNIDIPDHVTIFKPIQINRNMKGTLNLRPDFSYAVAGNIAAKPVSGSLSFDIMKNVSLEHNLLYLDCQNGQFCFSDTIPLVNESSFSGKSFCVGDTLKMYLNAEGGSGKYTYSYQVTKYNGSTVESKDTFTVASGKTVQEYKFDKKGKYDFEITVKDSSGKTSDVKKQTVNVYNKLVNKSTVSATAITIGNSVSINAAAQGGNGSYKYSVSYKKAADTKWTSIQGYQTSITEKVTPKAVGNYVIRVTVKDTAGNSIYTDYKITVNSKLTNTSKISATSIDLGKTVTVTASAQGGSGNYTYAVLYKKTSDSKWTTKQNFNANSSVSIKPANATTYDICAKVKDSQGTVEKKFFKLTVNKGIENKSTLSASTITLGSSVTVKCGASGGSGYYNYAVYYKKTSDTKWTTKQNFDSNVIVKITPAKATTYDICVKVRDSAGRETKKYFKLTVTNSELSNNSKISSASVKVNSSVTVTAAGAGGTSPYKYAFYYKNADSSSWTTKQDFNTNTSISIKFTKTGSYDICAKIKDSNGTVSKKYFKVTVTN